MMNKFLLSTLLTATLFTTTNKANAQGMAVNGTGATAATTAMLDVNSTAKGVLIPRMSTTQMNNIGLPGTPATGLMIYNTTTNAFYYYNGSAWTVVGSATGTASGDLTGSYPGPTVTNGAITNAKVSGTAAIAYSKLNLAASIQPTVDLATTGTPSATTFLRGDGSWATPAGGGGGTGASPSKVPLTTTGRSQTGTFYYAPSGAQTTTLGPTSCTIAPATCTPSMKVFSFGANAHTWELYSVTVNTATGAYSLGSLLATCSTSAASGGNPSTCTITAVSTVAAGSLMTFKPVSTSAEAGGFFLSFSCD